MPKIKILPHDIEIDSVEEEPLLHTLKNANVAVKSSCGGFAKCRDCIIILKNGSEHLNKPTFEEKNLLGNVFHITKERLSCQTKVKGSITIDLSSHNTEGNT